MFHNRQTCIARARMTFTNTYNSFGTRPRDFPNDNIIIYILSKIFEQKCVVAISGLTTSQAFPDIHTYMYIYVYKTICSYMYLEYDLCDRHKF